MQVDIERIIGQEVRFQWEETASVWNGGKKMSKETFEPVVEDMDLTEETIEYIYQEIRRRYNDACDRYQEFLAGLGEKY